MERLKAQGIPVSAVLKKLGVARSTFYHWNSLQDGSVGKTPPNSLLPCEEEKIVALKMKEPHLSHRQISG